MAERIDWIALTIFLFFFALVTVMGFFAARWKSGPVNAHLDEWGLGGRQFGRASIGLGIPHCSRKMDWTCDQPGAQLDHGTVQSIGRCEWCW